MRQKSSFGFLEYYIFQNFGRWNLFSGINFHLAPKKIIPSHQKRVFVGYQNTCLFCFALIFWCFDLTGLRINILGVIFWAELTQLHLQNNLNILKLRLNRFKFFKILSPIELINLKNKHLSKKTLVVAFPQYSTF